MTASAAHCPVASNLKSTVPIEIEGETLVKAHCTGGASTEGKKDLLGEVEGKEAGRE